MVLVAYAVMVKYAFRWNGHVTEAVGARAPATLIFPVEVPAVGLTFSATASVAAEVVAVFPKTSSSRERPTGLGLSMAAQPAGIEHTVFVPRTPVNAAMVV